MKNILNKISRSFSARFSLYLLLIVGGIFLITFSVFFKNSQLSIEKETKTTAARMLENANLEVEKMLLRAETVVENLKGIVTNEYLTGDSLYTLTRRALEDNSQLMGCAIAFEPYYYEDKGYYFSPYAWRADDGIYTKQLGSPEYDYFSMDWYQIPKLLGESYWSEPYFDDGGGSSIMTTYSSLMYDKQDKLMGIFTSDVSLLWMSDVLSTLNIYEGSYSFVLGRGGMYISHPQKDRIYNETIFSIAIETENPQLADIGKDMVNGGSGTEIVRIDGKRYFLFYMPISRIHWSLALVCPLSEVYAGLIKMEIFMILLGVLALAAILVFCIMFIRKTTKPLSQFAISATKIAHGEFEIALPEIQSKDEMLDMKNAFEYMKKELVRYMDSLQTAASAKEKIESELRVAREIQMGMLPKTFPVYTDRKELDLYAILHPAKEVGGDLYDFFISNDKLYFTIGDVSGKGIPASLLMAVTRSLFRSVSAYLRSTADIASALNNSIADTNETNMFVTLFVGILDLKTGLFRYCNAGHNPPVLMTKQGNSFLTVKSNIALGLFPDFQFEEQHATVEPNTTLFLYTDGLTEAENIDKQLYGEDRLMDCISKINAGYAKTIIEGVLFDVKDHVKTADPSDDLTMFAIKYTSDSYCKKFDLINDINQVENLKGYICQMGEALNLTSDVQMQINLALEEWISNVINYAYKDLPDAVIEVSILQNGDDVTFTVADTGPAFDPTERDDPDTSLSAEDRPIGGLGIFLIKQIMDTVEYNRIGEKNIFTMTKNINNQINKS